MKLLFDQNLSHELAKRLCDLFPGSTHVQAEGLGCTTAQAEAAFRARFADIEAFEKDPSVGTLALS